MKTHHRGLVDYQMKDILEIFDQHFERINMLLEERNFLGCKRIATDLITISVMSDFGDGIFVGEVFEGVFDQISPLFKHFEVSEEEKNDMKNHVKEQVALIAKSFSKKDKRDLYETLKNLRSLVTKFQFKCWHMIKPKPAAERAVEISEILGRK